MAIENAIRTRLLAQSAVTAITSRIEPYKVSQTTSRPWVMIEVPSETFNNDLLEQGGLVDATFRITAAADTLQEANLLADAIRGDNSTGSPSGLAGYSGTSSGVAIQSCAITSRERGFEWFSDSSDAGVFHVDTIGTVSYTEVP